MLEEMDPEIYKHGKTVFVSHSIPSEKFDKWVKAVAEKSGERVDWHCCGGRDVVKTLGKKKKVRAAIVALFAEHERLYEEAWPDYYEPEHGSGACFYIDDCLIAARQFMPLSYVSEQFHRQREKEKRLTPTLHS